MCTCTGVVPTRARAHTHAQVQVPTHPTHLWSLELHAGPHLDALESVANVSSQALVLGRRGPAGNRGAALEGWRNVSISGAPQGACARHVVLTVRSSVAVQQMGTWPVVLRTARQVACARV